MVRQIYGNILFFYGNGANGKACWDMQKAAFYAASAFALSYVGNLLAIDYTMGWLYGTLHWLAMAVILLIIMRQYKRGWYAGRVL
ncbi:MAG: hypothetical protein HUJ51_02230 [Eggerthellaceae bacterium]|nr:hypothetical protein [Eggerthellaceae bacterium]